MNIIEDISKLSTIPQQEVELVFELYKDCICYDIQEMLKNRENHIDINIGIGLLILDIANDELRYKFIPSNSFEKDIKYTLENNQCPLIDKMEENLHNKIVGAYKEFF